MSNRVETNEANQLLAVPCLNALPASLPGGGAFELVLEQKVPILRATEAVHARVEELLAKNRAGNLTEAETLELDQYEELDDYLSLHNRLTRNLFLAQQDSLSG
ncbi:MAG: hypothetical protein HYR56_17700 [Acidobacteria bacterium]|nr:hypothetical protein [Acidobacteriota bacterium]MBI3426542.1 hypothetical protein [Acidobacteriota bacterium]